MLKVIITILTISFSRSFIEPWFNCSLIKNDFPNGALIDSSFIKQ
jgi:hypothetical protein